MPNTVDSSNMKNSLLQLTYKDSVQRASHQDTVNLNDREKG